jgi:hypothetical protein
LNCCNLVQKSAEPIEKEALAVRARGREGGAVGFPAAFSVAAAGDDFERVASEGVGREFGVRALGIGGARRELQMQLYHAGQGVACVLQVLGGLRWTMRKAMPSPAARTGHPKNLLAH